jgi:hypothetical protein
VRSYRFAALGQYFSGIDLVADCASIQSTFVQLVGFGGVHLASVNAMPLYFFRIRNGRYSGASDYGTECADRDAAWRELTTVCADMASGISRKLAENSEWQMELLDEAKQPVFRIRIVGETIN